MFLVLILLFFLLAIFFALKNPSKPYDSGSHTNKYKENDLVVTPDCRPGLIKSKDGSWYAIELLEDSDSEVEQAGDVVFYNDDNFF